MCEVNISELRTNLSKYIRMLENGTENEIVICRYGKKVAKISFYNQDQRKMRVGCLKNELGDVEFELKKGFEDVAESFGC